MSYYTPLKFRVFCKKTRRIITDSSAYFAGVQRDNGIAQVVIDREDVEILLFTGERTVGGDEIYAGDIVEALIETPRGQETMTDAIYWRNGAWQFGTFPHLLSDIQLISVKGSRYETPWPIERPVV